MMTVMLSRDISLKQFSSLNILQHCVHCTLSQSEHYTGITVYFTEQPLPKKLNVNFILQMVRSPKQCDLLLVFLWFFFQLLLK